MFLHNLFEGFNWANETDGDVAKTFGGMIKNNGGRWNSAKQRNFILSNRSPIAGRNWTDMMAQGGLSDQQKQAETVKTLFNIPMKPGEQLFSSDGYAQWAAGPRGIKPVSWKYVVDDKGVVAKYKLKFKGEMRGGMSVDPSKTIKEWERDPNIDTSYLDKEEQEIATAKAQKAAEIAAQPKGQHVGKPGDRLRGQEAVVQGVFGPKHGNFGTYYINVLRDKNDNVLVNFGRPAGKPGDVLKDLSYTVKSHSTDQRTGGPTTIIGRAKYQNVADILRGGVGEGLYDNLTPKLNKSFHGHLKSTKSKQTIHNKLDKA